MSGYPQYPWHEGDHLFAAALNAAIANGPYLDNTNVLSVRDFGAMGDGATDDTAAIREAIAAALLIGVPAEVSFPPGRYLISGTISVVTSASQAVWLRGAAASCTTIIQTANADGIVMQASNAAGLADNGSMRVTGLAIKMTGTSTTKTGIRLSSNVPSGSIGGLVAVDDVLFQSTSVTQLWGNGLVVQGISSSSTWLSRITSVYPNGISASGLGTAITIQSTAPNYSSAINLRDAYLINGNTGLHIGDYLQGVHIQNLNTVNTLHAITVMPTVGGQGLEEIHISDSYLHGQSMFGNPAFPTVLFGVIVSTSYFDSIGGTVPANGVHVAINGADQIIFSNNIFNGPAGATANVTGLKITTGAGSFEQLFTGNLFQAYQGGGAAISLDSTSRNVMFVGTTLLNNDTGVIDAGSNNQFSATSNNFVPYLWGSGSVVPTGQAFVAGLVNFTNVNINGALFATDVNGAVVMGKTTGGAAGTPYIDFHSSGHAGHDAQILASGGTGAGDGTLTLVGSSFNAGGNLSVSGALFATDVNGSVILGKTTGAAAGAPYLAFHSSGHAGADSQIQASSGTGANDGNLAITAYLILASQLQLTRGIGLWGGTPPAGKPNVIGSKGGNTALSSLLTALVSYGLVTDSTTA